MTRLLAIVFALLAVAAGGWAVSQSKQLAKSQADLTALDTERAELRKKLWAQEKLNHELSQRVSASADNVTTPAATVLTTGDSETPGNARERLADLPGRVMAFMDNPEMQKMMAITQRANLDGRFSALFKNLRLSPAELEKFKDLLVEKQSSAMDVMAAARAQGMTGRENAGELRQMVRDSQAEIDNSIRATLGEAGFAQYKNYEQTLPQRTVVSQLDQRLSYSSTPLNPQQSEQLVQILSQNAPTNPRNGGGGGPAQVFVSAEGGGGGAAATVTRAFVGGGVGGSRITDQAVTQAQGVLSAPQMEALRALQQEQQAQAQLAQQMRNNMGGRRNSPGGQSPSTPPVPPKG